MPERDVVLEFKFHYTTHADTQNAESLESIRRRIERGLELQLHRPVLLDLVAVNIKED